MLLSRRVLFFGGKGGVGKTTLAAACAVRSADAGARTLLVSTDPAHSTSDVLGTPLRDEPRPVAERLDALEIDPVAEADRYIAGVKRRVEDATAPNLRAEVERQIDMARASPGAEEAALFERFARILDGEAAGYERVVFDTAPTGQTLRLLSLPEAMGAWMGGLIERRRSANAAARAWRRLAGGAASGREVADPILRVLEERRALFERTRALLSDAGEAGFVFVVIPERLPVLETERAVAALRSSGLRIEAVLVNQLLPEGVGGEFMERRRERESEWLERIDRSFAALPRARIALRERDVAGLAELRELAAELPA